MNFHQDEGAEATGAVTGLRQGTRWQVLFFELFIALSLAVTFFFLVRNYFAYGNSMNGIVFTAGSEKYYRLTEPIMGQLWNGRLYSMLFTGALMDYSLKENIAEAAQINHLANVFGLYHAGCLLLLFVCIIFALRHACFINFGIFAGLMYDLTPTSGALFYPWDLTVTLFFTLAVLFFQRRQLWPMVIAICAGAFVKETVLACALLIFFAGQWKWPKRIIVFAGILLVYALGKKLLMGGLHLQAPLSSAKDAMSLHGAFGPATIMGNFIGNLQALFSPTLNSVFFANAGTVLAVVVLGWQRGSLPYMTVIMAYLAALFFLAPPPGISEVRDFMQILPLSLILLTERWMALSQTTTAGLPATDGSIWATRATHPLLLPIMAAVIIISLPLAGMQYYIIFEDLQPQHQAQSMLGKYVYQPATQATWDEVAQWARNNYASSELKLAIYSQQNGRDADAASQYQQVLDVDTNSIFALNNLATLLAMDSDPQLRDGARAVSLAERACELSQYREPVIIYTLAAAYAEAGRFNEALATGEKARALAGEQGKTDVVKANDPMLEMYKAGHPFHYPPATSAP